MFQCSLAAAANASDDYGIRNRIEKDTRLFSIEVRDADVSDVLRALAEQSGFNIILGEGVEGKISLSFKDIAFKDALEIIIKARGLGYTVQNNVFWVGKQVNLSDEQVMDFIRLNYADPAAAVQQLKGALSAGGTAVADARTNSVIIKDLPKNIEAVRLLLGSIDIQTPQVLIEARIVEATTNFARQFGVQWGGEYTSNNVIRGSSRLPASSGGRNFAVNLPAAEATSGVGIVIGSISSKLALDIELAAAESKGELKIVSRPKIATLNNKPATIHSGLTFRVKLQSAATTAGAAGTTGASTTSGLQEIKTGIDLSVTPQISSDDFILLNINTNKSDPDYSHTVDGIPGVSEKSASTHVLIKDGETIVIGGLYKTITSEQKNSVPFLGDIPILGAFFRNSSKTSGNEELIVFITPTIIKYEKAQGPLN